MLLDDVELPERVRVTLSVIVEVGLAVIVFVTIDEIVILELALDVRDGSRERVCVGDEEAVLEDADVLVIEPDDEEVFDTEIERVIVELEVDDFEPREEAEVVIDIRDDHDGRFDKLGVIETAVDIDTLAETLVEKLDWGVIVAATVGIDVRVGIDVYVDLGVVRLVNVDVAVRVDVLEEIAVCVGIIVSKRRDRG